MARNLVAVGTLFTYPAPPGYSAGLMQQMAPWHAVSLWYVCVPSHSLSLAA